MSTPRLIALWRHPVKSLQGEQLLEVDIQSDGLRGDRCWGIRDEETGRILTGRREPKLLLGAATTTYEGEPELSLPDGQQIRGVGPHADEALSNWLGRPVTLVPAEGAAGGNAEFFADATDDSSPAIEWTMPAGRFVDAGPLLVLTTASLRAGAALYPDGDWDVRRFRPNLLLEIDDEGWVEDGWAGRELQVGSATIVPKERCVRCTMVTRPQPCLARDLDIYKTLSRHHGGLLGMWTDVQSPGTVRVGDPVVTS